MAKKEDTVDYNPQDFEIDSNDSLDTVEVERPTVTRASHKVERAPIKRETELISCLRNERIIVRHIPK